MLELTDKLRDALPKGADPFEWFLQGDGEVHRHVKNRLTYEVQLGDYIFTSNATWAAVGGKSSKNGTACRKPVVSARTEWEGAAILAAAGVRVPDVLGKGERGRYPHAIESFVVLDALEDCETLEHFKHGWMDHTGPLWVALKRALIGEVARMAKTMHGQGINHRDFYINHFLINREHIRNWQPGQAMPLTLIDLHRVQHRAQVPRRWLIKDLASLLFSALDAGLTSADYARYMSIYLGPTWKQQVRRDAKLWRNILQRGREAVPRLPWQSPRTPPASYNGENR